MLYKKNKGKKLDMELYKNPTSEYRATPFWAWNCKLDKEVMSQQIEDFKKMGYGGFHMHSRSGLATKYLGEDFMDCIKFCRDKAEKEGMLAWLYDEDRWPSGFAGGYVTLTKKYRQKKLHFTSQKVDFYPRDIATEEGLAFLIGVYDIELTEDGYLKSYKRIGENDEAKGIKRYAFVEPTAIDEDPDYAGWHNGGTPVDGMSHEAMQKFLDVTHESYKREVGESFDSTIPAIFMDEPQFGFMQYLPFAKSDTLVMIPWTTDFTDTYMKEYGEDIADKIPELFFDLPNGDVSVARYRYHEHSCQRFTDSTAKKCGTWCKNNGIALTGHMMWEQSLEAQTRAIGEAMRAYEWFEIPGMDLLCDRLELNTAKQVQSAVRQYGKEAMLTELYGVTNWDFDFRGHKFQGDWQVAMGATVRAPHLAWMSMKGSAKRDYPASLSAHIPWYEEYKYVENHFARLATVLSRGESVVNVGVIHPIESFWIHFGPADTSSEIKESLDRNFANMTKWLYEGMVDFDFISEALLPKQCNGVTDKLNVSKMNYSTIIVPGCKTLRRTTFELLKEFAQNGGKLIFAGECPEFIDAMRSEEIKVLYNNSTKVDYEKLAVLSALESEATAKVYNSNGNSATNFVHQLRRDNDELWFFMAHSTRSYEKSAIDMGFPEDITMVFDGQFVPTLYNTIEGTTEKIAFEIKDGKTYIYKRIYPFDSILLCLEETEDSSASYGSGAIVSAPSSSNLNYKGLGSHIVSDDRKVIKTLDFKKNVSYKRTEDNVLVVDMAEYKLDDEATFHDTEEILRIDEKCRQVLGFPKADGRDIQPWALPDEPPCHYITIRYEFTSLADIENTFIAGEEAEYIKFNGESVELKECGYYVDRAIKKYKLGTIKKGVNTIEINAPITKRISLENYFVLGNFDVIVKGCEKIITTPSDTIGFSDITSQGMPFYGGNVIYSADIEVPKGNLKIRANRYRGALIKVALDGETKGRIVYPPYTLEIPDVSEGKHKIEFTLFGNRVNTFGPLHDSSGEKYVDPGVWYTRNYALSYEYEPKQTGIISSPVIDVIE